MIIWTGRGIFVVFITMGSLIGVNCAANVISGTRSYWETHHWLMGLAFLLSGVACWLLGQSHHREPGRVLMDPQTGEQVTIRPSNTLFFIPTRWWGPILGCFGLVIIVLQWFK